MNPVAQPQTQQKPLFPFLDLHAQFEGIREEVMLALQSVFENQQFILGPEVQRFERELAELVGCRFAIGCASGSDALALALMAIGVGVGDEVITTPFTFIAAADSIARVGARPVFVDINPDTYNLDPKEMEALITSRTKAILPVHLFGLAAPMDEITAVARSHDLAVIEDAAQAIGATHDHRSAGSIGNIGCFSFFPSKNLGGAGDGGMLSTNDSEVADRLRMLRAHGSRTKYHYEYLGLNSRLDTLQAAILRVKLRHLVEWTLARRQRADCYRLLFTQAGLTESIQLPVEPPHCRHVYNQFVIRTRHRDQIREHLSRAGIPTEIYYPLPLHLQPAFSYLEYKAGDFPYAESASREVLALPIFPELTEAQQQSIVGAITDFHHAKE
jgi:dTDP-4-amino-4,6-dideoxygalactose transaminase